MDKDKGIDDLLFGTDSSESTSSSSTSNEGRFKGHTPFVLELHNIRKDDPVPAENVAPGTKIKKHKKKKKGQPAKDKSHSSVSSDSISEASSVAPSAVDTKEEFYDAHESYHAIPENQRPVIAAAMRLQSHSEDGQTPKTITQMAAAVTPEQQTTASTARKEPSTITKPSVPPE